MKTGDKQVLHNPKWNDTGPLFDSEFQHSAVVQHASVRGLQLDKHWIVSLEACQDLEGQGHQEVFIALFQ